LAATRESKVILNQEAEDEKLLMILQNQKQLKKKGARTLGDNRKLIILNRLLNPIEDPQVGFLLKAHSPHIKFRFMLQLKLPKKKLKFN